MNWAGRANGLTACVSLHRSYNEMRSRALHKEQPLERERDTVMNSATLPGGSVTSLMSHDRCARNGFQAITGEVSQPVLSKKKRKEGEGPSVAHRHT